MKNNSMHVGLDVHKDSIEISTAEQGREGEVRRFGQVGGDLTALDKAVHKLHSTGRKLQFVYEAGPCGDTIYRHLTGKGFDCKVVAPSLTPRKPGDRVKTDRRDAISLARLDRAGELTYIHVPTPEDEAMRDLVRACEDAKRAETRARQQLLETFRPEVFCSAWSSKKAGTTRYRSLAGWVGRHGYFDDLEERGDSREQSMTANRDNLDQVNYSGLHLNE